MRGRTVAQHLLPFPRMLVAGVQIEGDGLVMSVPETLAPPVPETLALVG
ncbi:MAG: hypothetical protein IT519_02935 [Burkholderiales bacterium]|nr:hypothetical protein [Burkholderiales bacterium]